MADSESVILAFTALREASQPTVLAHGMHAVAPPGQHFVRVSLVPDIPYYSIMRCIEDMMQGDSQLDGAEACAQMAASLCNRVDQIGA